MLGRGIDQVLPQPCDPTLHEDYVGSALGYVRIAEEANGPIPRPVPLPYVWGVALEEFAARRPDARIVNLETSITRSDDYEPKGINYRMSPENAACLAAAGIDCCVLGNNHILDWGRAGLCDTLATLERLRIKKAGAGRTNEEAALPAIVPRGAGGRVLIYSFASPTSGTPEDWAAKPDAPGVNLLPDLSPATVSRVVDAISRERQASDLVVASIHWGSNWGYSIAESQRRFAHALIDDAGVSVIHGHSSHHAKAMEVYRGRLILYGCGDFLNDYEGIAGNEEYRGDLAIMYFADFNMPGGALTGLELVPLQIRQFRLGRPSAADIEWVRRTLERESRRLGAFALQTAPDGLSLRAGAAGPLDAGQ